MIPAKAEKYLALARDMACLFSKDSSTKVGAIFLAPGSLQVLSMGYNGMPRGIDESIPERWERPTKYKFVEHAERNAVYNAARHGTPLEGCIAVVTMFPCADCARALVQVGVRVVVAPEPDVAHRTWGPDFEVSMGLLREAGVEIMFTSYASTSSTSSGPTPVRTAS